jgi:Tfp pilus assembly major pilin PilA
MKALQISSLIAIAVVAASAAFAGPGLQYWQNQQRSPVAKESNTTGAAVVASVKCKTMSVQNGKTAVACTGAVTNTAQCKAACGM